MVHGVYPSRVMFADGSGLWSNHRPSNRRYFHIQAMATDRPPPLLPATRHEHCSEHGMAGPTETGAMTVPPRGGNSPARLNVLKTLTSEEGNQKGECYGRENPKQDK